MGKLWKKSRHLPNTLLIYTENKQTTMKDFMDFLSAALPWLCMGLLLAIFFAKSAQKKNDEKESRAKKRDNYSLEGMCFGICLGVALGASVGNNTGIGLSFGMLLGLVIGSCIEKKGDENKK